MPIDVENFLLFVHIPKTGGTSISKYFNIYEDNCLVGPARVAISPTDCPDNLSVMRVWKQHFTLSEIRQLHFQEGSATPMFHPGHAAEAWKQMFKFTFVRNPWDRDVSNFFYLKSKGFLSAKSTLKDYFFYVIDCFQEHEQRITGGGNHTRGNREIETVVAHCKQQHLFFADPREFDFVGRYEHLLDEMATICGLLNRPFNAEDFPWEKKAHGKKHYTTFYDDETIALSALKNQEDIRLFGYKFGG